MDFEQMLDEVWLVLKRGVDAGLLSDERAARVYLDFCKQFSWEERLGRPEEEWTT